MSDRHAFYTLASCFLSLSGIVLCGKARRALRLEVPDAKTAANALNFVPTLLSLSLCLGAGSLIEYNLDNTKAEEVSPKEITHAGIAAILIHYAVLGMFLE